TPTEYRDSGVREVHPCVICAWRAWKRETTYRGHRYFVTVGGCRSQDRNRVQRHCARFTERFFRPLSSKGRRVARVLFACLHVRFLASPQLQGISRPRTARRCTLVCKGGT